MHFKFSAKFALSALATVIWSLVIFSFSAQNGGESSGLSKLIVSALCELFNYSPSAEAMGILTFLVRKSAHMTEFGILGLLVLNTIYLAFGSFKGIYFSAFAVVSAYAALDEIHQLFIPDRSGRFTDWLIDSAGVLLFMFAAWFIIRTTRAKRTSQEQSLDT